ncbi:MAG: hypothetical protein NTW87_05815 [Planctomycetota bacterium]|nr:hypothetical protein [Planctomycetota bacterium]
MPRSISRRQCIQAGITGALAVSFGRCLSAAPAGGKPNVLIITTDQQRVDAMSLAGNA